MDAMTVVILVLQMVEQRDVLKVARKAVMKGF